MILLISVLFGIYCFVFGQSGMLERDRLNDKKILLNKHIENLEKENRKLTEMLVLYKDNQKLLEEAEKNGFVVNGSKIIYFKDNAAVDTQSDLVRNAGSAPEVNLEHLRILWITVSILCILLFLVLKNRKNSAELE